MNNVDNKSIKPATLVETVGAFLIVGVLFLGVWWASGCAARAIHEAVEVDTPRGTITRTSDPEEMEKLLPSLTEEEFDKLVRELGRDKFSKMKTEDLEYELAKAEHAIWKANMNIELVSAELAKRGKK